MLQSLLPSRHVRTSFSICRAHTKRLVRSLCVFTVRRGGESGEGGGKARWENKSSSRRHPRLAVFPPGGRHLQKQTKMAEETLRHVKNRKKGQTYVNNIANFYLQVIGAGSRDTCPSLFVFSDTKRYLFNCGEGTQRIMMEHKVKVSRMEDIFLTRLSWNNVGGLGGMTLTLQGIGVPEVRVYGPPNAEDFYQALKDFTYFPKIKVDVKPYQLSPMTDDVMTVWQVPIRAPDRSSPGGGLSHREGSRSPDHDLSPRAISSPSQSPLVRRNSSGVSDIDSESDDSNRSTSPRNSPKAKRRKTSQRDDSLVISYICKLKPRKGRFLSEKALMDGIKPGVWVSELKKGNQATLPDGRIINPEDYIEPDTPGPVFIVVECPDEEFIVPVTTNSQIAKYQDGGEERPAIVVHFTPVGVVNNTQYQEWIRRFGPDTEHLFLNEDTQTTSHKGTASLQACLHTIQPTVFPLLADNAIKLGSLPPLPHKHVRGECMLTYWLFHRDHSLQWDRSSIPLLDNEEAVKGAFALPGFEDSLQEMKETISATIADDTTVSPSYPEVVFFGTGSSIPSKRRNVTGILVHLSETESLLLDGGEGTFGQMYRHYGDQVDRVLANIKCVFISHIHADHHLGLMRIFQERRRALQTLGEPQHPMYLIAPLPFMSWINHYRLNCENIGIDNKDFILLLCKDLSVFSNEEQNQQLNSLKKSLGFSQLQVVPVLHVSRSYGLVVSHKDDWKLVYSGDSMPCDALIMAGKDATLLIHEATFDDELHQEAKRKRHSTISQAVDVGREMNASFNLLTHFSQRYPKIPLMDNGGEKVGIAFDHMKVRLGDLKLLPHLSAPLQALFQEELEEMKEKQKRHKRNRLGGLIE
ncbi:zinc phosphodiesterase ELAC protein 2-like [Branchiostoma lanceolatum]